MALAVSLRGVGNVADHHGAERRHLSSGTARKHHGRLDRVYSNGTGARFCEAVPSAIVTVGLSNVVFIDADGEQLLRRMAQRGVEFDGGRLHEPVRHREDFRRYVMATMTGVMPTVRGDIRQSTTWSIVLSVLMMVSGVLAIAHPADRRIGGHRHVRLAADRHRRAAPRFRVARSTAPRPSSARSSSPCCTRAVGFYMLARPVAGLASLTLAIAAYLVAKGVLEGAIAFKLRPMPGSGWLLFDGILTIAHRRDDRERMAGERRLGGRRAGRRRDGLQRVRAVDGVDRRAAAASRSVERRRAERSRARRAPNRRARPAPVSRCAGGASSRRATSV